MWGIAVWAARLTGKKKLAIWVIGAHLNAAVGERVITMLLLSQLNNADAAGLYDGFSLNFRCHSSRRYDSLSVQTPCRVSGPHRCARKAVHQQSTSFELVRESRSSQTSRIVTGLAAAT